MIQRTSLLIDSSFFYSLFNADDDMHSQVLAIVSDPKFVGIYPEVTLSEVAFLFKRLGGSRALATFMTELVAQGIVFQAITTDDLARGAQLLSIYTSANLDFVDCCLMAMAERLNIRHIGTLDRRDFSICRPAHCDYFILLP